MPIPATISELSATPSLNSPQGTESAKGTIDDYLRSHAGFIKQMYDALLGPSVTLPSASTINAGFAASANIVITGTATINAFDTAAEGVMRYVTFNGAMTLTHSGAFQLPGAANILTVSGDVALFKSLGGGTWKCMIYQRASGVALAAVTATATKDGYLAAADWSTFNAKQSALAAASASSPGYLLAADWTAFNGKQAAIGYSTVNKAGDTMLGTLTAADTTGVIANPDSHAAKYAVRSSGAANAAFMSFFRAGEYGGYFGIDSDNVWKVGGWSAGAVSYSLLHSGNVKTFAVGLSGAQTIGGVKTFSSPPVAVNACKAWANFDGTLTGTIAPRSSFNITSITKNGTGDYTLNFPEMPNANYVLQITQGSASSSGSYDLVQSPNGAANTTTSARFAIKSTGGAGRDADTICITIFGG